SALRCSGVLSERKSRALGSRGPRARIFDRAPGGTRDLSGESRDRRRRRPRPVRCTGVTVGGFLPPLCARSRASSTNERFPRGAAPALDRPVLAAVRSPVRTPDPAQHALPPPLVVGRHLLPGAGLEPLDPDHL